MLLGGRTADLRGRRRALIFGLMVLSAASLAAGLAPDPAVRVGARAVQGVGAAVLSPATLTTSAVTSRVAANDAGIVSGLVNAARQLGGSIGLAALTTAAAMRIGSLHGATSHTPVQALASGYDLAFAIAAILATATALIATTLP